MEGELIFNLKLSFSHNLNRFIDAQLFKKKQIDFMG